MLLFNELDLDPGTSLHLLPVTGQEFLLELIEPVAGCTHQIADLSLIEHIQVLLADQSPVKDPDPVAASVAVLHLVDDLPEGGGIMGIAGEELIAEGQPLGGHHQGQH